MSAMPDVNGAQYNRWEGRSGRPSRTGGWVNIALGGIRLLYARPRTQRLVMASVGFVLAMVTFLYLLSLAEALAGTQQAGMPLEVLSSLLRVDLSVVTRLEDFRGLFWRALFVLVIKAEVFWIAIVVAVVGPGLIANDLKTRALPVYFAHPITPATYLIGKWLVVATFVAVVSLVPNLLSLIIGAVLTGGLSTLGQTAGLAGDVVVSGVLLALVAGIVVLALSSLTSDSRFVAVGWLAVCLLPSVAQSIVTDNLGSERVTGWLGTISLRDNVVTLTEWLFDMKQAWAEAPLPSDAVERVMTGQVNPYCSAVVLGATVVVAGLVAYRRVVKFSRAAANV